MASSLEVTLVLAYGYLLGSVPTAYLIGRIVKGIDLRQVGSGTIGASNVYYNVGRFWTVPVGLFDLFVKGLTPVYLASMLGLGLGVQVAAGLLAVIGHDWPIFLRFKGGRGVAPTVGILIALGRLELALFIVMATAGWQMTKASAVWVLLAFASLPLVSLYFDRPTPVVWLMVGLLSVTVTKRLASNALPSADIGALRVLINRLLFDRDIADNDEWVRRNPAGTG